MLWENLKTDFYYHDGNYVGGGVSVLIFVFINFFVMIEFGKSITGGASEASGCSSCFMMFCLLYSL